MSNGQQLQSAWIRRRDRHPDPLPRLLGVLELEVHRDIDSEYQAAVFRISRHDGIAEEVRDIELALSQCRMH